MHRTFAWLTDGRVRLALLLGLLTALVVYVLATRTDALGSATGTPTVSAGVGVGMAAGCPARSAPSVATVSRATLQGLREDLRGVMFGRGRRLYERGVIASSYAWSDDEPGKQTSLPPGPHDPGGYELRWWAADRDDVVAEVYAFADAGRARDFFAQASSTRCRLSSVALAASSPPGGRDLAWRNPDRFAQEDLYLLRGQRVYVVSVVRAGAGPSVAPAGMSAGFSLVNGLACNLPDAACHPRSDRALAQQTLAEQLVLLRRRLPGANTRGGGEGPGACAHASEARGGETGSALSESLHYGNGLELRVGTRVYADQAAARRGLERYRARAALSCVARLLASSLRRARAHPGPPRDRLVAAAIGQGALAGEVAVPFSYRGRAYEWVFDGVILREGRILDDLSTLASAANLRADERLAARLAQARASPARNSARAGRELRPLGAR